MKSQVCSELDARLNFFLDFAGFLIIEFTVKVVLNLHQIHSEGGCGICIILRVFARDWNMQTKMDLQESPTLFFS